MTISVELGIAGQSLWDGVAAVRKITPALAPVLFNACRIADNLDQITAYLSTAPMLLENSRGEDVTNPMYGEHRQQSLALARLLTSLGIDKLETQATGEKSIAEMVRDAVKEAREA